MKVAAISRKKSTRGRGAGGCQTRVAVRFENVEVLLEGGRAREVGHLPHALPMEGRNRYF